MNCVGTFRVIATLILVGSAGFANAYVITTIDFTGGTATQGDGDVFDTIPGEELNIGDVTFYEEDGYVFEFVGGTGWVGDFYVPSIPPPHDVLHAHFGDPDGLAPGSLTAIRLYGPNATFNLHSFDVTTNTGIVGGAYTGLETAYITGYDEDGETMKVLLPFEDWGLDSVTTVDLSVYGDAFLDVLYVEFTVEGDNVYGLGFDNFRVSAVPEPATLLLFGAGLLGLACRGIRRRKSAI